jgi:hypothetical protein
MLQPPRFSSAVSYIEQPSEKEAALSRSSTYRTSVNITCDMSQAVLDAIIHNVLHEHARHKTNHHVTDRQDDSTDPSQLLTNRHCLLY